MTRRQAINQLALLMAGTLSSGELQAMFEAKNRYGEALSPIRFSQNESQLIAQIAELIIPTTNTPGAKEAGVGQFIEIMLRDCYSEAQVSHFKKGLIEIENKSQPLGGPFLTLNDDNQKRVLTEMVAAAKAEVGKENQRSLTKEPLIAFFSLMKSLTLFGYFTSEAGCKQQLDYQPLPGKYEGCMPLKKGQKAYAL